MLREVLVRYGEAVTLLLPRLKAGAPVASRKWWDGCLLAAGSSRGCANCALPE